MKKSSSLYVTTWPELETKSIAVEEVCFQLSYDLGWPYVQRVVWLYGRKLLRTSHQLARLVYLAKFSRDLARTRDQRTLGLSGRNLLIVYSYSAKFNSYTHSGIGYIILLVCHVIWQGHVIIWPCNLLFNILGSKPWSSVTILLSLEGRRVGGQVTLRAGAH